MPSDDFTLLVNLHYTPLFRFAVSLAKNSTDAADLTQETFLIWAKRGHSLRDVGKVKSWLFTTLYREYLKGRRQAWREEALEDLGPDQADPPAPDPLSFSGSGTGVALEAMHDVDEVYRVSLSLFYLQDFSYKEIAEMLDVPIGTVMSRIARGKIQLRDALATRSSRSKNHPPESCS